VKHIFRKGENDRTLMLFHGTGGSEKDLIPIAEMIDPKANILSVRGDVLENGMSRFFKRISEGVFDEQDLTERTHQLKVFIDEAVQTYNLDIKKVIGFGYSNGANILGSLLFHYHDVIKYAILSHPMISFKDMKPTNLDDTHIFIGAGYEDPLIDIDETKTLIDLFKHANSHVKEVFTDYGHRFSELELKGIIDWYQNIIKKMK
jgi:phospholipase/carboxylesterase